MNPVLLRDLELSCLCCCSTHCFKTHLWSGPLSGTENSDYNNRPRRSNGMFMKLVGAFVGSFPKDDDNGNCSC